MCRRLLLAGIVALACRSQTPIPAASPGASPAHPEEASVSSPAGGHAQHQHAPSAAGGHRHGLHRDFSDAQAFSKSFDDPARDAWQRPAEVIEHMHIEPGQVVADIGAGTGYFAGWLSRAAGPTGKVMALDVEPEMVEFLRQRAEREGLRNVTARVVAPDDPGLAPGSVDRVLIVDTWHHIDDRERYAAKLAAALRPEGELWIVDFTLDSDLGPPVQYRIAPEQVARELEASGLHAEIIAGEQLPKQYLVRATRR